MNALRRPLALLLAASLLMLPLVADGLHTGSGGWGNVPSGPSGKRGGGVVGPRLLMLQELKQDLKLRLPKNMNGSIAYLGEVPGGITMVTRKGRLILRGNLLAKLAEAGVSHAQLMFVAPTQETVVGDLRFDTTKRTLRVTFP